MSGTFRSTPPAGTVLQPGAHALHMTFAPSTPVAFTPATATADVSVGFTEPCITTAVGHTTTIGAGDAICLASAGTYNAKVTVTAGGAVFVTGGTIAAPLDATGASAVTICGATISGRITITGTTGPVVLAGTSCTRNRLDAPVRVIENTGGVSVVGNSVSAPLTVTGDTGPVTLSGNTTTAPAAAFTTY